jgi:HAD superfamily hydrolase (TIGR01458 family)
MQVGVRAVLLDLEGTLFEDSRPVPGAARTLSWLAEQDLPVRFLTNIDSRPPETIARELATYGLDIPAAELFSPVTATRQLFTAVEGARVYPLLSDILRKSLNETVDAAPYTHVLVGDCRDVLSYSELDGAFRALRAGAELVALQRGRYFKRADGDHVDTGAVVAGLEYAAGVRARVLGKPSADFFQLAARSAGVGIGECLVVGDDVTTDITGGHAAGAQVVQVRTGKYADQRAEGLLGPDTGDTIDSVADLPRLLGDKGR